MFQRGTTVALLLYNEDNKNICLNTIHLTLFTIVSSKHCTLCSVCCHCKTLPLAPLHFVRKTHLGLLHPSIRQSRLVKNTNKKYRVLGMCPEGDARSMSWFRTSWGAFSSEVSVWCQTSTRVIIGQKCSIRHDYKTNSWILEKPGNSWKVLENIWTSENGFIPDLLFIPDFILNFRILPSQAPTNQPTILLDILCLANPNEFFFFLGFA